VAKKVGYFCNCQTNCPQLTIIYRAKNRPTWLEIGLGDEVTRWGSMTKHAIYIVWRTVSLTPASHKLTYFDRDIELRQCALDPSFLELKKWSYLGEQHSDEGARKSDGQQFRHHFAKAEISFVSSMKLHLITNTIIFL
jgi:hypothetical protein